VLLIFLGALRKKEHISSEKTMPGIFRDDANGYAVFGVCAYITVLDKNITPLYIAQHPVIDLVELFHIIGTVIFPPPDILFR